MIMKALATLLPSLYQVKYPTPGAPDLAKKVHELLIASGFESVHIDKKCGLGHATWVPLMLMYPEADIPVCELSIQLHLDGAYHYNLGRALGPLIDDGVLIIGSGNATHPSWDTIHYGDGVAPWAAEFDSCLETALTDGRYEEVNTYETKAPNWKLTHPIPDDFYPLHVAIGAAGENCKADLIHSSWYSGILTNGILSTGTLKHYVVLPSLLQHFPKTAIFFSCNVTIFGNFSLLKLQFCPYSPFTFS